MKKKHFYTIRALCFGTLSLFLFIIPFVFGNNEDIDLTVLIVLMAIVFAFFTYQAIKKSKESNKVQFYSYAPLKDSTAKEQINFYWKFIIISTIAFPLLSFIIYMDLNDLQSGIVENVRIWAPVAFLYNQFGYLTALLSVPTLGIFCISAFFGKIYSIKKEIKN
jgi:heme/copper-type cytochrome/quinol oxidase subunit 2